MKTILIVSYGFKTRRRIHIKCICAHDVRADRGDKILIIEV